MHKGFGHSCGECYFSRDYTGNFICKINGKVKPSKKACGMFKTKPQYMVATEELYSLTDVITSASKVKVNRVYFYADSPSAVLSRARHSASFPGYAAKLIAINEFSSKPFGFEKLDGSIAWFRYVIGQKSEPKNFQEIKEVFNA